MLGEDLYVTALAFCEKGYEFELLSGRNCEVPRLILKCSGCVSFRRIAKNFGMNSL